jgi:hypothetical protein
VIVAVKRCRGHAQLLDWLPYWPAIVQPMSALYTQVNDLMSELSTFNEDLAYLKLGEPRSPYDTTSTKISRDTRSATLRIPKYMSFGDQLHQIRIRLKDKKSERPDMSLLRKAG